MADHSRLITHYGLFWSEADVYWGIQGKSAQFFGLTKPITKRGTPTEDELEKARKSEKYGDFKGIYALYNDFQLIYVGQAGVTIRSSTTDKNSETAGDINDQDYSTINSTPENQNTFSKRIRQHRKGPLANRWQHFSWFGVKDFPPQIDGITALAQLEAICIALAEPRFNKQSGAFKEAEEVYQVPHPDSDGDLEKKLNRLMEQINSLEKKN